MRRPREEISHDKLIQDVGFILRTLLRDDLFGEKVRLTEAERVIDKSLSISFADYCGFLNKYGYIRIDQLANVVEVTEGGAAVARNTDDSEFQARLGRHFARELGPAPALRPPPRGREPPPPPPASITPSARLARDTALEEVIDRRYRRGAVIGSGPVGEVFEAEQIALARRVAIKEARSVFQFASYLKRDDIVRRLKERVQQHAALVHPNIAQILDQNHEREFPYFVLEYASGGSLRRRLQAADGGGLDLNVAVRVLLQIGYALRYGHEQGVLHLGVKPENVLFDHLGNVKLADFGISRVTHREEGDASQAPVLVGSGTVAYLAPEALQPQAGPDVLGPPADVYATGILCYQMLTGKLPGRRSRLPSQVRKEVPAAFDDVFDRMTRDDLSERYATISEVLTDVYKAFTSKVVYLEGTILQWANDPTPPPEPEPEPAPEPEAVSPEPEAVEAIDVDPEDTESVDVSEPISAPAGDDVVKSEAEVAPAQP